MKKLFPVLTIFVLILTACSNNTVNKDYSDYNITRIETDREIYTRLDELLPASDIVVRGKFCSDTKQELFYDNSDENGNGVLIDAVSTNYISVSDVLYGNTEASEIRISQRYGAIDEKKEIVTFSSLTPMYKDDEWIFFLYYDNENDTYWCAGDYCGRMPVFSGEIKDNAQKYIDLQIEYDELLRNNESISPEDIEAYINEGVKVFYGSEGSAFVLSESDTEKALNIREKMTRISSQIEPYSFGVYSIDDVKLDLYAQAVRYFNLSQSGNG